MSSVDAPRSFDMAERATFTLVVLSTDMNIPTTTTARGTPQPGSAGRGAATGGAGGCGSGGASTTGAGRARVRVTATSRGDQQTGVREVIGHHIGTPGD